MRQISRSSGIRGLLVVATLFPSFVLCRTVFGFNFTYINPPLLAVLQLVGALGAISAGLFAGAVASFSTWRKDAFYPAVSAALLAMGLGSAALALRSVVDDSYLFLDSMLQLVGATFMSFVWLGRVRRSRIGHALPLLALLVTPVVILLSDRMQLTSKLLLPERGLSALFIATSNLSAFILGCSACFFFASFRRSQRMSDLVFCYFALLSGLSSIFWLGLRVWGPVWWVWHVVQPLAYICVLAYLVLFHAYLEKALESSEKRFQLLANSAFEGIVVVRDGLVHDCNVAFSTMMSIPPDNLRGRSIFWLFPDLAAQLTESFHSHETVIRRGGREIPVEIRSRNEGTSRIIVVRDLTEEKRLAQQSAEHEARLSQLFHNSIDGVAYGRVDGSYLEVNDALCALSGYSREELCSGVPVLGLSPMHLARPAEKCKEKRGCEFEREIVKKNGEPMIVLQSTFLLPSPEGAPRLFGTFIKDVTEKKQAMLKLKKLNEDLLRSNEQLDRFASIASHDLAEPLRTIAMYLTLLERKNTERLDPESRQYIASAVQAATRLRSLIDGLLDYARIGAQKTELIPTDVNIALENTLANLQTMLGDADAEVTHDPLPTLHSSPPLLEQLLQNLVANALKYRSEDKPEIHIGAANSGEEWRFSVRDNGRGIPAEFHKQIFTLFARADNGHSPGVGIGLATCKRIVERLGGKIWVESEQARGATFFFTLPTDSQSALRA